MMTARANPCQSMIKATFVMKMMHKLNTVILAHDHYDQTKHSLHSKMCLLVCLIEKKTSAQQGTAVLRFQLPVLHLRSHSHG